jgi:hypothetical protein
MKNPKVRVYAHNSQIEVVFAGNVASACKRTKHYPFLTASLSGHNIQHSQSPGKSLDGGGKGIGYRGKQVKFETLPASVRDAVIARASKL